MGFGKDGKGAIINQSAVSTLGALARDAAIKIAGPVLVEDFRVISAEIYASLIAMTTLEGQGLIIGIAQGDLTAVEIAEALTATPLQPGQVVENEQAMRFTKIFGGADGDSTVTFRPFLSKEGGPVMRETVRWTFRKPTSWSWFVFNSGQTLTTGGSVNFTAKHFGVWV